MQEVVGPHLLDEAEPVLELPNLPWVLEYGGQREGVATIYLRKSEAGGPVDT